MTNTNRTATTQKRIYYTGDLANLSGWFTAEDVPHGFLKLTEEPDGEDRVLTIRASQIGDVYRGHANPRFVTESAYRAFYAAGPLYVLK